MGESLRQKRRSGGTYVDLGLDLGVDLSTDLGITGAKRPVQKLFYFNSNCRTG